MPVAGPDLLSCSATVAETLVVPAITLADGRVFISKNHKGNPWREFEMFTITDVRTISGPLFFNLDPIRVDLNDPTFQLVSGINVSGDTIRFWYNSGTSNEMRLIDFNAVTLVSGQPVTLGFTGRDPFVVDARTGLQPNRMYVVYVNDAGNNAYRQSFDNGLSWESEVLIDDVTAIDHIRCEANLTDPLGIRENVQVVQLRT